MVTLLRARRSLTTPGLISCDFEGDGRASFFNIAMGGYLSPKTGRKVSSGKIRAFQMFLPANLERLFPGFQTSSIPKRTQAGPKDGWLSINRQLPGVVIDTLESLSTQDPRSPMDACAKAYISGTNTLGVRVYESENGPSLIFQRRTLNFGDKSRLLHNTSGQWLDGIIPSVVITIDQAVALNLLTPIANAIAAELSLAPDAAAIESIAAAENAVLQSA